MLAVWDWLIRVPYLGWVVLVAFAIVAFIVLAAILQTATDG